jgi:hypothetical protein
MQPHEQHDAPEPKEPERPRGLKQTKLLLLVIATVRRML